MSSALFTAVCSIAPTRRRRFFWAAWWTAAPTTKPFRKPDAADGGARTREAARAAAEQAAGRTLVEIDGGWARAWSNVVCGKEPWDGQRSGHEAALRPARAEPANHPSVWQILGLSADASEVEIKAAYRKGALAAHPDRGGSDEAFRTLQTAYERALRRRTRRRAKARAR